jgi:hypothetical protein
VMSTSSPSACTITSTTPSGDSSPTKAGSANPDRSHSVTRARSTHSAYLSSGSPRVHKRSRTAGVCAFSVTSRITQRDGTTGRDAPDNCTLLSPGDPGPRRPAPPRRSRASGRLPEPRPAR